MTDTCPQCGRPSWRRHGGMGGGLKPDAEMHCLKQGNMFCRIAAEGYAAGRRDGIDEGVKIAKEWVEVEELHGHEYVNFENVERKAEKAKEGTR